MPRLIRRPATLVRIIALGLSTCAAASAARADAIGPPEAMSDAQKAIIGVWQEDGCAPRGFGHVCERRTLAIASTSLSIMTFAMTPEDIFSISTETSAWNTKESMNPNAFKLSVTLKNDNGETVEGEVTIAPDADGKGLSFTGLSVNQSASHFTQIVGPAR